MGLSVRPVVVGRAGTAVEVPCAIAVDEELELVRRPVHAHGVKVGQVECSGEAARQRGVRSPGVLGRVGSRVDALARAIRWSALEVLHDVDLPAGRPRDFSDVVAECPKCGPGAQHTRNLEARLPTSICDLDLSLRCQAARGDAAVALPASSDVKHPVAQKDVLGRVDVALQLVIPASIAVGLDVPRATIENGAVEVVAEQGRRRRGRARWRR